MKLPTILALSLCLLPLAGCRQTYGMEGPGKNHPNAGDLIRGASLDKALIVQRTLYPYHFVVDGAGLNELGERDVHVLAAHFRQSPGVLRISRGDADNTLYDARIKAVMAALVDNGVEQKAMKLSDGLPGGDGITSTRVVQILTDFKEPLGGTAVGTGVAGNLDLSNN